MIQLERLQAYEEMSETIPDLMKENSFPTVSVAKVAT